MHPINLKIIFLYNFYKDALIYLVFFLSMHQELIELLCVYFFSFNPNPFLPIHHCRRFQTLFYSSAFVRSLLLAFLHRIFFTSGYSIAGEDKRERDAGSLAFFWSRYRFWVSFFFLSFVFRDNTIEDSIPEADLTTGGESTLHHFLTYTNILISRQIKVNLIFKIYYF